MKRERLTTPETRRAMTAYLHAIVDAGRVEGIGQDRDVTVSVLHQALDDMRDAVDGLECAADPRDASVAELEAQAATLRDTVRDREQEHLSACAEADELRAEVAKRDEQIVALRDIATGLRTLVIDTDREIAHSTKWMRDATTWRYDEYTEPRWKALDARFSELDDALAATGGVK